MLKPSCNKGLKKENTRNRVKYASNQNRAQAKLMVPCSPQNKASFVYFYQTKKLGTAVVLITHNLGVVARYADRVNVMYAGQIIERGSAEAIFANPLHAYTKGLMSSVPRLDETEKVRLNTIEGQPPLLLREIDGCAFAARNPNREHCLTERHPALIEKEPGHWVADCPGCLM